MSENKELTIGESLKETSYIMKWGTVLIIMGLINIVLSKSYGPLKDNFFSVDLTNNFMSAKKLMVIFTLLIFSIIYGIREWTRLKDFSGTTVGEKKEEFSDFMIYIIISLSTFLYANAYIRRKFNTGGTLSGGGDDGLFKDSLSKVSATNFGTLTIYVGMLVILLNIVTNTFQYLKNKKKNQKDKMLRAIYFGQISTMFQFIITSFFVMGFGMSGLRGKSISQTSITGLKWTIVIAFSITSIHLINKATNFENWFGEPKDVQHSNQK